MKKSGNILPEIKPANKPMNIDDVTEYAQRFGVQCIQVYVDAMNNGRYSEKIQASSALLDRAYGKSGQRVELTGKDGGPVLMAVTPCEAMQELLAQEQEYEA